MIVMWRYQRYETLSAISAPLVETQIDNKLGSLAADDIYIFYVISYFKYWSGDKCQDNEDRKRQYLRTE